MKTRTLYSLLCILGFTAQLYTQWLPQVLPTDVRMLLSVDFADRNRGAASGYTLSTDFWGRVVYTTNAGSTWTLAQVPDSARSLVTIQFISPDTGYIAGAYNIPESTRFVQTGTDASRSLPHDIYTFLREDSFRRLGISRQDPYSGLFLRTTDGGQSWHQHGVLPDSVSYLIGMCFLNGQLGFVTGDRSPGGAAIILKTTNGGANWTQLNIPDSIGFLRHITFVDSLHGFAAGYRYYPPGVRGVILETSNGGTTWVQHLFPTIDSFWDIRFVDQSTGYVVGFDLFARTGVIYRTTNSGADWLPIAMAPDTTLLEGIRFAPSSNTGIVYGEVLRSDSLSGHLVPTIATTTDGGVSWVFQEIPQLPEWTLLLGGKLITDSIGYVCGGDFNTQGVMLHTSNRGATFVLPPQGVIPQDHYLYPNYPNPFNPSTTITYDIPRQEYVVVRVYSLLGQDIVTLVDRPQQAGRHSITWNGRNQTGATVSSGLYVCRLQVGSFIASRKMIFVK